METAQDTYRLVFSETIPMANAPGLQGQQAHMPVSEVLWEGPEPPGAEAVDAATATFHDRVSTSQRIYLHGKPDQILPARLTLQQRKEAAPAPTGRFARVRRVARAFANLVSSDWIDVRVVCDNTGSPL